MSPQSERWLAKAAAKQRNEGPTAAPGSVMSKRSQYSGESDPFNYATGMMSSHSGGDARAEESRRSYARYPEPSEMREVRIVPHLTRPRARRRYASRDAYRASRARRRPRHAVFERSCRWKKRKSDVDAMRAAAAAAVSSRVQTKRNETKRNESPSRRLNRPSSPPPRAPRPVPSPLRRSPSMRSPRR